ncbi:MAG TPA: NAD-dependent protein deacylase [Anaerolineales bacterium]|nr:NAD-dependent protein deacylase [Anaerolineales bacterium]
MVEMSQVNFLAEIAQAASLMAKNRRAVAFTGAGISTRSGIPDFRSPETGLWARAEALQEKEIERGTLQGFIRDPQALYEGFKPLIEAVFAAQPNAAHLALAEMEEMEYLQAVVTQNGDMLHQKAGLSNVIELHGTLGEVVCISCYKVYPSRPFLEQFLRDERTPICPDCRGVLKPNVILTGEQLPVKAILAARSAIRQSDLILIAGTSLVGGPATALVEEALVQGKKIIVINLTPTIFDTAADVVIRADVVIALPALVKAIKTLEPG